MNFLINLGVIKSPSTFNKKRYRQEDAKIEGSLNASLKNTLLEKINTPQKKSIFLKFIQIIQKNSHDRNTLHSQFKDIASKLLHITADEINVIIEHSIHQSSQSSWFRPFYTHSLNDLLKDLALPTEISTLTANLIPISFLSGLNLQGVNLSKANLLYMDLSEVDLRGANLSSANLYGANLCGADLSEANLMAACISHVDFQNAKLYGTNFQGVDFRFVENLNDTIKDSFPIPNTEEEINLFFNDYENFMNILKTINSIEDVLKVRLMENLILQINNLPPEIKSLVLKHKDSFAQALCFKNQYTTHSSLILEFVQTELLPNLIFSANLKQQTFTPTEANLLHSLIMENIHKRFLLDTNGFIAQFIYFLKISRSKDFQEKGLEIEERYLSQFPEIEKAAYIYLESMGELNEGEQHLNNNMLLISPDEKNVLVVSYDYYEKFILEFENEAINLDNIAYFKSTCEKNVQYLLQNNQNINFKDIFEKIILFKESYNSYNNKMKIFFLLDSMNLGDNLSIFKDALKGKSSRYKFNTFERHELLDTYFKDFIQSDETHTISSVLVNSLDLQLTTIFTEKIIDLFEIAHTSIEQKAQTFACLSALFVKLSSKSFFGTDMDSPLIIRNFAIALLNKAIEYDAKQVPNFEEWKNILAGIGEVSCTAILYDEMSDCLKNKEIYSQIMPAAWL